MNRIRLLPEHVANQIAAGEVVERPASVVKELVENALDAQATSIIVEIQAGGRFLVRITDNGCGMSRDDALMCLERHATSKIRSAADLQAIATMGFRGEALPSIASVSRLTLTTRENDPAVIAATQVIIHGGRIQNVREAGAPPGTCVEVRNLFFNLPARRKFLRSEETERAHIQHVFVLASLANPQVGFSLIQDQRPIWQLAALDLGAGSARPLAALRERLRLLYGSDQDWMAVDFSALMSPLADGATESEPPHRVSVWGFIGAPGQSRSTRDQQHLFVNRRPIENRGLNYALMEGYHTALMKGRYPVCCLFLEIDPEEVDVNVHPAKREVRFRRENEVRRLMTQAIRQALIGFHASPQPEPVSAKPPEPGPVEPAPPQQPLWLNRDLDLAKKSVPPPIIALPPASLPSVAGPKPEPTSPPLTPVVPRSIPEQDSLSDPTKRAPIQTGSPTPSPEADNLPPPRTTPVDSSTTPLLSVPLRIVGVIGKLYVVLESDRGLVLLDQHAAHERILFEQMLNRLEQGNAPSQRLLLAETLELSPRDADFLREQLPALARLGVGVSEFGERTFLLDALPPFVHVADARQFVLDLVDELKAAGQTVNSWRLGEHEVAKTVCRHAVKAEDPLGVEELAHLLDELRQCAMPYTCPHGRPTLIEINYRELEKKFGRVV